MSLLGGLIPSNPISGLFGGGSGSSSSSNSPVNGGLTGVGSGSGVSSGGIGNKESYSTSDATNETATQYNTADRRVVADNGATVINAETGSTLSFQSAPVQDNTAANNAIALLGNLAVQQQSTTHSLVTALQAGSGQVASAYSTANAYKTAADDATAAANSSKNSSGIQPWMIAAGAVLLVVLLRN